MTWLIILGIVLAAFVVYKFRVPILARILGQPESRVRRQIEGPK